MQFIHDRKYLNQGDVVVVDCDHQCNVRLMDDSDFNNFRNGSAHRYYGGHFSSLPAKIVVPSSGNWNVTLDLGGGTGSLRYGIRYLSRN